MPAVNAALLGQLPGIGDCKGRVQYQPISSPFSTSPQLWLKYLTQKDMKTSLPISFYDTLPTYLLPCPEAT